MTPDDLASVTRRPSPGPHDVTVIVDGNEMRTLADLPPLRDRLLFVYDAPDADSVAAGHHRLGPTGRSFWRRLMLAGVLPTATDVATADDSLLASGHGIASLDPVPVANDDPNDARLRLGVGPLWQKIALWRPAAVVFADRRAASAAAGRPIEEPWGALDGVALGGRPCFLMPDPFAPVQVVDDGLNLLRNLAAALPRDRS